MAWGCFTNKADSDSPVYFQSLSGGAPRAVIPCVAGSRFSVVPRLGSTMCPASPTAVSIVTCPFAFETQ